MFAFWVIAVTGGVATLLALAPLFADEQWWARLPGFAMAQLAIILLALDSLATLLLNLTAPPVLALIAAMTAALAYLLWHLAPYTPLASREIAPAGGDGGDRISVLSMNLLASNRDVAAVLASVAAAAPDLFLALEANDFWQSALAPLLATHPHRIAAERDDYWGMVLYSRLPLTGKVHHLVSPDVPSIRAEVTVAPGRTIRFVGAHPRPPMLRSAVTRDAELVSIGLTIGDGTMPALLAGDLNDVPWSRTMRLTRRLGGLRDPRVGRGFLASFKVGNAVLRWPLDHVFATSQFKLTRWDRLPPVGSDHFPLLAGFVLSAEPVQAAASPRVRDRHQAARLIARGRRTASAAAPPDAMSA